MVYEYASLLYLNIRTLKVRFPLSPHQDVTTVHYSSTYVRALKKKWMQVLIWLIYRLLKSKVPHTRWAYLWNVWSARFFPHREKPRGFKVQCNMGKTALRKYWRKWYIRIRGINMLTISLLGVTSWRVSSNLVTAVKSQRKHLDAYNVLHYQDLKY